MSADLAARLARIRDDNPGLPPAQLALLEGALRAAAGIDPEPAPEAPPAGRGADVVRVTVPEAYGTAKARGYYPVPYGRYPDRRLKFPDNVTGGYQPPQYAPIPDDAQYMGMRLPDGVLSPDVDDHEAGYGEPAKHGVRDLEEFRVRNGLPPLAPTYKITSRGPGDPGGKYLYRATPGRRWVTALPDGAHVDVISVLHKFVAGVPGTFHHKTGTLIECYGPDGNLCDLPPVEALPWIGAEWEAALERHDAGDDGEDWDQTYPVDGNRMCTYLAGKLADPAWPEWSDPGGRHAFDAVYHVLSCGAEGHFVRPALEELRTRHEAAFGGRAGFAGMVKRAAARVKAPEDKPLPESRLAAFYASPGISCDCLPPVQEIASVAPGAASVDAPADYQPVMPARRRRRTTAAETPIRRVEYLWEPYVPASMITVLGGMEGSGKTQVAFDLCARVTRAGRPVIILSPEDPREQVTVPRLIAAGADLTLCHFFDADTGDADVTLRADLGELGEFAGEIGAALVVFDPIVSVLDAETDGDSYKDVSRELGRLAAWASITGVSVLAVTHLRKASDGQALNKMMGSRAFTSKPRSVLMTALHPEDPDIRLLAHAKSNVGPQGVSLGYAIEPRVVGVALAAGGAGTVDTSAVRWCGTYEMWSADALAVSTAKAAGRPPKIVDCAEFVRGYLTERGGVAPVTEVRAAAMADGYGQDMLRSAEFKKIARITHGQTSGVTPTIHYWSLIGDDGKWVLPSDDMITEWRWRL